MDEFWGGVSEWLTGTPDIRQWDWGSTADWVTGLLTAVAVLIAAQAFRHDRMLNAQSHARQLRMRSVINRDDDPWTHSIRIDNFSEDLFTDVSIIFDVDRYRRKSARRAWKRLTSMMWTETLERIQARDVSLWQGLRIYYEVRRRTPIFGVDRVRDLEAPNGYELMLPIGDGAKVTVVTYRDIRGQTWGWDLRRNRFLSKRRLTKLQLHANEIINAIEKRATASPPK
ncbi:hypothetical protein [Rathayibacter festucae]|uniref:Uncharacterized protein n=1 Tax=Rathayibacter festucae DSM 15932 TaxID=1328866 RepID=A0A3T0SYQ9_9MICO|nr:hypothetical protein [Rathayibacter festucae]AZZ51425.1 hypothetical protein C1I64_04790 [Rathayibacter festucae DSM 15932]